MPVKFRCFQCNQLLGISQSKVGTVVSCPKCSAELIVPEPVEAPSTTDSPAPIHAPASLSSSAIFLGFPQEVADIRPEDIRVEPGLPDPPPSRPALPPDTSFNAPPEPPPRPAPVESEPASGPKIEMFPDTAPPDLPSIQIEPSRIAGNRPAPPPRQRDVVLPRAVVLAWSLFVLLALALVFVAGLLAGHYVWKVH